MEDKELQELEEFSLEDIIKEFSDHPQEDSVALAEDVLAEELGIVETPEIAEPEEKSLEEMEEAPAKELEAEEAAEETEMPAEEATEEPAEEVETEEGSAEEADPALCGDTVRLDSSELLKGVVHDAQPIDDEAEEAAAAAEVEAEEEEPAFSENWEPEYEQPMGEYVPPQRSPLVRKTER